MLLLLIFMRVVNFQSANGLNIDSSAISTSGISAGGSMATQFHVAFSSEIMGAGLFAAGGPYYCAEDSLTFALGRCMENPENVPLDKLISETESFATSGDIDDPSNLEGSKVYIWHGAFDSTVRCGVSLPIRDYYENFGADVVFPCINRFSAGHCQPVANDASGIANEDCASQGSPYINNCGYDGAFHCLNHIYGDNLEQPDRSNPSGQTGTMYEVDQGVAPGSISLNDVAYVYVPTACDNNELCKLHVAFHGCLMDFNTIDDDYIVNGGYNEVADLNNIVILYPQTVRSFSLPYNPNGCFDWWGYTDSLASQYTTKNGEQMQVVKNMVDGLVSGELPLTKLKGNQ